MKKLILVIFTLPVLLTSCLFDNRADFYTEEVIINPTVFFSVDIFPIIQEECVVCHNTNASSGGLSLHQYENIKVVANNGSLLGSIKGTNGYQIMPQNGSLSDSQIELIEAWIQEGALDN